MSQIKAPALILPIAFDLQSHLDTIEYKLKANQPLSNDHIKLLKDLIPSFRRLWKLSKQYPIMNSNLDINLFKNIFNDMSVDYSESSPQSFRMICDFCGAKFPIIGNNAEMAFHSHSLTVRHVDAIRRMFKTSDNLTKSISGDISVQLMNMKLDDSDPRSSAIATRSETTSESASGCIESKPETELKLDEEAVPAISSPQMTSSTNSMPFSTQLDLSNDTKTSSAANLNNSTFEHPSNPSIASGKPQRSPALRTPPSLFSRSKNGDYCGKGNISRPNLSYSQPTSVTESFKGANTPERAGSKIRRFSVQDRLLRFRGSQDATKE